MGGAGGYNANRMTARDAEDAPAALRLLLSRAEQSLDHRGVKTNPLLPGARLRI